MLARHGHVVHIAFLDRAADLDRDAEFEADFLEMRAAQDVQFSFLGHEVRRKPWLGALRLRRLVRDTGADVIHSHLAFGNLFSAAAPGIPLIYTHHSENMRFSNLLWKYFRRRAARLIGISERCTENLSEHSGNSGKVVLIRNGINISAISPRNPQVSNSNYALRAICVGRVTPQKNYPMLAEALSLLPPSELDRLRIDVFGEGDASIIGSCKKILQQADINEKVLRFRGISSRIRDILSEYDMFLMSSDWEGLPIALIEAAAAGLPIIATDVGGCREAVEAGPSGLVVPAGEPRLFAEAISKLMQSPELREKYSRNSKLTAKAFSIEQTASQYARVYQDAIST